VRSYEESAATAGRVDLELARKPQRIDHGAIAPVLVGQVLVDGRCNSLAPAKQRARTVLALPPREARTADRTCELRHGLEGVEHSHSVRVV